MHSPLVIAVLASLLGCGGLLGCSGDEARSSSDGPPRPTCRPSEILDEDGGCVLPTITAGLPDDMACAPGEMPLEEGVCRPAGLPSEGCAPGFTVDGDGHCLPVLPDPCPAGRLAVPGDVTCHAVGSCGEGSWGDIPVEGDTQHVDANYEGGDSDGSAVKPWTTIQEGVDAAGDGGLVAVAAGSYPDFVGIEQKSVRLRGRCAAMVELTPGDDANAIIVSGGADGSVISGVTVRGGTQGITVFDASDVRIENVHVEGSAIGVGLTGPQSRASMTLLDSLVEATTTAGVLVLDGGDITVERSLVRGIGVAQGLSVQGSDPNRPIPTLAMTQSVVEDHAGYGVAGSCGRVALDAVVVRGIVPDAAGHFGFAAGFRETPNPAQAGCADGGLAVEVRRSLLTESHVAGLWLFGAAMGRVVDTVVRDINAATPGAGDPVAVGMVASTMPGLGGPELEVRHSLVEDVEGAGLYFGHGKGRVEAVHVRNIRRLPDSEAFEPGAMLGRGLWLEAIEDHDASTEVDLLHSRLEHFEEIGVVVRSGHLDVDATFIGDPLAGHPFVSAGGGLQVVGAYEPGVAATLRRSRLHDLRAFGVYLVGSETLVEQVEVGEIQAESDEGVGDGLIVAGVGNPARLDARRVLVDDASRAGVASFFGGEASLEGALLRCNVFDLVASSSDAGVEASAVEADSTSRCGCPAAVDRCQAVVSELAPPAID